MKYFAQMEAGKLFEVRRKQIYIYYCLIQAIDKRLIFGKYSVKCQ